VGFGGGGSVGTSGVAVSVGDAEGVGEAVRISAAVAVAVDVVVGSMGVSVAVGVGEAVSRAMAVRNSATSVCCGADKVALGNRGGGTFVDSSTGADVGGGTDVGWTGKVGVAVGVVVRNAHRGKTMPPGVRIGVSGFPKTTGT